MNMMSLPDLARCFRTSRVLQQYLDGETDELTAARVAEHLEECRRCGLQARTYRAIKTALRTGAGEVDELALRRLRDFSPLAETNRRPAGPGLSHA